MRCVAFDEAFRLSRGDPAWRVCVPLRPIELDGPQRDIHPPGKAHVNGHFPSPDRQRAGVACARAEFRRYSHRQPIAMETAAPNPAATTGIGAPALTIEI